MGWSEGKNPPPAALRGIDHRNIRRPTQLEIRAGLSHKILPKKVELMISLRASSIVESPTERERDHLSGEENMSLWGTQKKKKRVIIMINLLYPVGDNQ